MVSHDIALIAAGAIGAGVAVVHGVLIERVAVKPILDISQGDKRLSAPARRLVRPLMHESTASWFLCGLVLIAAALWFDPSARLTTSLFAGAFYAYGALGNLWATRGRHPGWVLYAIAVALIGYGAAADH
jgi:hypothetical protein